MEKSNLNHLKCFTKGQDIERQKIAEELHDQLGSTLVAARLWVDLIGSPEEGCSQPKVYLTNLIDQAIEDVRAICKNLIPFANDLSDFPTSIKKLAETQFAASGLKYKIAVEPLSMLDNNFKFTLYRICQETFANIAKHSEANEMTCLIGLEQKEVILKVADDGKGFNLEKQEFSLGLNNIKTRCMTLGGSVKIHSAVGNGTKIKIRVPYES